MVMNESLIYAIPQELVGRISGLITILQILGGAIILYVIFGIVNTIINKRKKKELQKINHSLEEIKIILKKSAKGNFQ